MKKFIKGILFIGLLFVLIEVLNLILIPKHSFFKASNYEISGEKDNSVDVVFLGDSLVYSSVSPMELWNEFGYTSFDCAEAAQIIPDSYRYLEFVFENQKPKVVFMEANVLFRDPKKRKIDVSMAQSLLRVFPIVKYHDNWKKYLEEKSDGLWVNIYKGYKYITKIDSATDKNYMAETEEYNKIPEHNMEYFDKIVDLCKENDAKLILIGFPSQTSWKYKKHNTATKVAKDYGLEFIDLNIVKLGINWVDDTKDKGAHLNHSGAKKVSTYIGNYIKDNNLVEDHREDDYYKAWDTAYKLYIKGTINQQDSYKEQTTE